MEEFGISASQNFTNSNLASVFTHGEIINNEQGVSFQCADPKLFRIPYNCTLIDLKRRICRAINISPNSEFTELLYRKPTDVRDGIVIYASFSLLTDEHVSEMLSCKYNFPIDTIIELYATYMRAPEDILNLLNPANATSSVNPDSIPSTKAILYFGGPPMLAGIQDCDRGFGLMFTCCNPRTMFIQHDWTYSQLYDKISEVLDYGDFKRVTTIDYRRPARVDRDELKYDVMEIKNDNDVRKMIATAKLTHRIHPTVRKDRNWQKIELFIQLIQLRPPTTEDNERFVRDTTYINRYGYTASTLDIPFLHM